MIQVYNKASGKYKTQPAVKLNLSHVSNTRSNIYKLQLTRLHFNLLESSFFSNRIVAIWNSSPNTVMFVQSLYKYI